MPVIPLRWSYNFKFSMALVKVKDKYQVTIPAELREEINLEIGDLLEVVVESNKITLVPKRVIDRQAAVPVTSSLSTESVLL